MTILTWWFWWWWWVALLIKSLWDGIHLFDDMRHVSEEPCQQCPVTWRQLSKELFSFFHLFTSVLDTYGKTIMRRTATTATYAKGFHLNNLLEVEEGERNGMLMVLMSRILQCTWCKTQTELLIISNFFLFLTGSNPLANFAQDSFGRKVDLSLFGCHLRKAWEQQHAIRYYATTLLRYYYNLPFIFYTT